MWQGITYLGGFYTNYTTFRNAEYFFIQFWTRTKFCGRKWRTCRNIQKYLKFWNGIFKFNQLFGRHVLKPLYYGIVKATKTFIVVFNKFHPSHSLCFLEFYLQIIAKFHSSHSFLILFSPQIMTTLHQSYSHCVFLACITKITVKSIKHIPYAGLIFFMNHCLWWT